MKLCFELPDAEGDFVYSEKKGEGHTYTVHNIYLIELHLLIEKVIIWKCFYPRPIILLIQTKP